MQFRLPEFCFSRLLAGLDAHAGNRNGLRDDEARASTPILNLSGLPSRQLHGYNQATENRESTGELLGRRPL